MPRTPLKVAHAAIAPSVQTLAAGLAASAASIILGSVAGAIAMISLAFAIHAGFELILSPALASASTGLVFTIVAALIAYGVPRMIKSRAAARQEQREAVRSRMNATTLRTALDVGLAVAAALAETAAQRRLSGGRRSKPSIL